MSMLNYEDMVKMQLRVAEVARGPVLGIPGANHQVEINLYYHDATNIPQVNTIKVDSMIAEVLKAAFAALDVALTAQHQFGSGTDSPTPPGVMVRQRSTVFYDDRRDALFELGADGSIHVRTGQLNNQLHMSPSEAGRFVSGLNRMIATATGLAKMPRMKAQRDCVHCLDNLPHDKHETTADIAARGAKLGKLLRAQRGDQ